MDSANRVLLKLACTRQAVNKLLCDLKLVGHQVRHSWRDWNLADFRARTEDDLALRLITSLQRSTALLAAASPHRTGNILDHSLTANNCWNAGGTSMCGPGRV
ncbi:hypothetical protein PoB_001572100 [Plakobranchus ocellatus]|uniref:Uncharacterized protein n=1 Tax=Plakobranchus ocellatus TaxID=259542 RepID=A0AAV3Z3R6_9GAST|nr:hypothetical protein PoB_001572100 [Plakobranchus ocellatus]